MDPLTPPDVLPKQIRHTRWRYVACAALLFCTQAYATSDPQAVRTPVLPVGRSALLVVEAMPINDAVAFHVQRANDHTAVISDDVKVTVDGKNETVTRESDGTYQVDDKDLLDGPHDVDVTVGHDGIREVLSGKITLPQRSSGGRLGEHKQIAWWILNIAVVLIAAIALSRRKAKGP